MLIDRFHYALSREDWLKGIDEGRYRTSWPAGREVRGIRCTLENYAPFLGRMSEHYPWNKLQRNAPSLLLKRLGSDEAALFELVEDDEVIGNAFVTSLNPEARAKFFSATTGNVIEFETLGIHSGTPGYRSKAFFEMLFEKYFENYDTIYWSQNDIHHPALRDFYLKRLGMHDLGTDQVEEPNLARQQRDKRAFA